MFVAVRTFYNFPQLGSGPPVVQFERVKPQGQEVFAYYNIPDPRAKVEQRVVDVQVHDQFLSHLTVQDVNHILPSSDTACPGDGTCKDDLQVLIQFKLK
jgi:hypothetical protein